MAFIFDIVQRLEADPNGDLARGFAAETADPLWLIGRAWQMCEHEGEDASSPVRAAYVCRQTPIDPLDGDVAQDPRTTPAEAIVESEPGDRWTVGLRVRVGRAVEAAASGAGVDLPDAARLANLPVPYDHLEGTGFARPHPVGAAGRPRPAGRLVRRSCAGRARAGRPLESQRTVLRRRLLRRPRRPGAEAPRRRRAGLVVRRRRRRDARVRGRVARDPTNVLTGRLRYPGAPLPRWWQIEDGARRRRRLRARPQPPRHGAADRPARQHSDDWFGFPVGAVAGTSRRSTRVSSRFVRRRVEARAAGRRLEHVHDRQLDLRRWSCGRRRAPRWPGPSIDDAVIGIDEDANLVWAVERRLHGRDVPTDDDPPPVPARPPRRRPSDRASPTAPSTYIPNHWHPYVVELRGGPRRRRFVQGRAADFSGPLSRPARPAEIDLLQ